MKITVKELRGMAKDLGVGTSTLPKAELIKAIHLAEGLSYFGSGSETQFTYNIETGKRSGLLTYDEINDALPSEFFSPNEIEDLMDILQEMGVKVVDNEDAGAQEEAEEEPDGEPLTVGVAHRQVVVPDRLMRRPGQVVTDHRQQEAGQGDGHAGQGHPLVAEQRLATEHGQQLADDAQTGQDKDIDRRMGVEPEQVLEQDRVSAFGGIKEAHAQQPPIFP